MSDTLYAKLPLEIFYGQPSILIPDSLLPSEQRCHVKGTANLHQFEGIAEPWRDGHHILVFPAYVARQLYIEEGSIVELAFTAGTDIPKPSFTPSLTRLLKENPDYARAFNSLTQSDQLQYLMWISSARTPAELDRRSEQTIKHIRTLLNLGNELRLVP
jgi:hypothetical protein